jgi:hypothetical protein
MTPVSPTNIAPSSAGASLGGDKRSLNKETRKKELLKITMENQAILRRLQDKQSSYSVLKWENGHKEKERMMKNICEFPMARRTARSNMTRSQETLM